MYSESRSDTFPPEAQRSCACVSKLRLWLFMTFKEPAAVLILLLWPLQIGCSFHPSPPNPLYILFTSGYVCSAEVPKLAIKLAHSGAAVDEVVWSSAQTDLPLLSLIHLKLVVYLTDSLLTFILTPQKTLVLIQEPFCILRFISNCALTTGLTHTIFPSPGYLKIKMVKSQEEIVISLSCRASVDMLGHDKTTVTKKKNEPLGNIM